MEQAQDSNQIMRRLTVGRLTPVSSFGYRASRCYDRQGSVTTDKAETEVNPRTKTVLKV